MRWGLLEKRGVVSLSLPQMHERGSREPASKKTVCLIDLTVFYRSALKPAGASNSDKHVQFSLCG